MIDFVVDLLAYVFGILNMILVPVEWCGIISKPIRLIMQLLLFLGAAGLICINLGLAHNSIETSESYIDGSIVTHQNGEPYLIIDILLTIVLYLSVNRKNKTTIKLLKATVFIMLTQLDRLVIEGWKIGHQ